MGTQINSYLQQKISHQLLTYMHKKSPELTAASCMLHALSCLACRINFLLRINSRTAHSRALPEVGVVIVHVGLDRGTKSLC